MQMRTRIIVFKGSSRVLPKTWKIW